jgi:hypothetical protein
LREDFTEDGRLRFPGFRGKPTWLKIRGKATFWRPGQPSEVNFHHYALRLKIGRGLDKSFWLQVMPTLFFFDEGGNPIVDKRVGPRRRRITKAWWNGKWLNRLLAAEHILLGLQRPSDNQVILEGNLRLASPVSLNESLLGDKPDLEDAQEAASDDQVFQVEQDDQEAQTEESNE